MGLKRFDYKLPGQRKNFKQIAMVLCICLIAVLSFTSYALYQVNDQKQLANTKVGEFNTSDVSLAILVDGVKQKEFPSKDSGKSFLGLSCTNGGTGSWDKTNWKLTINDISGPTECTIRFGEQKEYADDSGAEQPDLNNGMIPVTYNTATSKWVKADTSTKWYDYDAQWWANAVTVSASSRSAHASSEAGTEIPMDDIETMWVWVPRYEYNSELLKDPNYGGTAENPGTQTQPKGIEINFISKDTVSSSSSNFTIHDAFKWGDEEASKEQLAGIWVAKFKMSTGATTCTPADSSVGTGCDLTDITPLVKPGEKSWSGARIGTMWTVIHEKMNHEYGLSNLDAHLMKNMEWGAVAYLSQSKYGKYGNANYTGVNKEIYINNYWDVGTLTGCSSGTPSTERGYICRYTYEKSLGGTGASTTGNIYGIYDMSGGAWEYVMGVMKASGSEELAVGYSTSVNSGWSGKVCGFSSCSDYIGTYDRLGDDPSTTEVEGIGTRYYDLYEYGTDNAGSTRYHKGDATYEVSGWYSDYANFVDSVYPFFLRGGNYSNGTGAGVFNFGRLYGYAGSHHGGRPVAVHQAS